MQSSEHVAEFLILYASLFRVLPFSFEYKVGGPVT